MFYERVGKKGDGLNQNKAYKRVYRYLFRKRNTHTQNQFSKTSIHRYYTSFFRRFNCDVFDELLKVIQYKSETTE